MLMTLAALAGVILFSGLGIWQVQRLHCKTDLIARVEARLAAAPVAAPGPADWAGVDAQADEYRRVEVAGRYDFGAELLAKAVTGQGSGYWVMTPLVTDAGWRVWVNRGFVPDDRREAGARSQPAGEVRVTGLLRISQPGGGFLRANDPAAGRWFSRDVAAMSAAQRIEAAPYFIDADAQPGPDLLPVGGLTVVSFRNSHLSYALTWFAMAIGLAGGAWYALFRRPADAD
ncbi:SURF1 family protein [Paracoccus limosus]|uniref:SURF1-like protein n=2 Tax=Paracoccus limosus TaxID=913252 RepID=A0A844H9K4_9RHOB|nr:SURF1 family protein [Paracoccus limosus]